MRRRSSRKKPAFNRAAPTPGKRKRQSKRAVGLAIRAAAAAASGAAGSGAPAPPLPAPTAGGDHAHAAATRGLANYFKALPINSNKPSGAKRKHRSRGAPAASSASSSAAGAPTSSTRLRVNFSDRAAKTSKLRAASTSKDQHLMTRGHRRGSMDPPMSHHSSMGGLNEIPLSQQGDEYNVTWGETDVGPIEEEGADTNGEDGPDLDEQMASLRKSWARVDQQPQPSSLPDGDARLPSSTSSISLPSSNNVLLSSSLRSNLSKKRRKRNSINDELTSHENVPIYSTKNNLKTDDPADHSSNNTNNNTGKDAIMDGSGLTLDQLLRQAEEEEAEEERQRLKQESVKQKASARSAPQSQSCSASSDGVPSRSRSASEEHGNKMLTTNENRPSYRDAEKDDGRSSDGAPPPTNRSPPRAAPKHKTIKAKVHTTKDLPVPFAGSVSVAQEDTRSSVRPAKDQNEGNAIKTRSTPSIFKTPAPPRGNAMSNVDAKDNEKAADTSSRISLDPFDEFSPFDDKILQACDVAVQQKMKHKNSKSPGGDQGNSSLSSPSDGGARPSLSTLASDADRQAITAMPPPQRPPSTSGTGSNTNISTSTIKKGNDDDDLWGDEDDAWLSEVVLPTPQSTAVPCPSSLFPERSASWSYKAFTAFRVMSEPYVDSHTASISFSGLPLQSISDQVDKSPVQRTPANPSLQEPKPPSISCGEDLFSSEDDDDMLPESGHVFIVLKEGWSATNISRGHVIHIIWDPDESVKDAFFKAGGGFEGAQAIGNRDLVTVDDANHWLVVSPDQLLAPSNVAESSKCLRSAVLRDGIKESLNAKAATFGNVKHDLFERVAVLNRHDISLKDITDLIPETIAGRAVDCYAAGITDDIITDELIKFAPLILKSGVANGKMVLDHQGLRTASQYTTGLNNASGKSSFEVHVKRVVATEESVHSHMWGVKSRPDMSHECSRCYTRDLCMLHNATFEASSARDDGSGLDEMLQRTIDRLSIAGKEGSNVSFPSSAKPSSLSTSSIGTSTNADQMPDDMKTLRQRRVIQYFREWSRLLNLEDRDLHKHLRHFYDTSPAVREEMGICASNLRLVGSITLKADAPHSNQREYPHVYKFARLARGARVLLAAYTNSAVDNVLLKLKEQGFDEFVRVGNPNSMRPEIKPYAIQEQCRRLRESDRSLRPVQTVDCVMSRYQLIASTCLSATDPVLSGVSGGQAAALQHAAELGIPAYDPTLFDYCIVDEASQIHEPVCLGPLLRARRFVLVGDPNQLSAVVKSRSASALGMGKSLFERLGDAHPQAICRLRTQYRMNRDITKLANALVYRGQLKCGTPAVSSQRLIIKGSVLSNPDVLPLPVQGAHESQSENRVHWLKTILSTNRSVVFVDTDGVRDCSSSHEIRRGKRKMPGAGAIVDNQSASHQFQRERNRFSPASFFNATGGLTNAVEVTVARLIVQGLVNCGINANDVGVISPYHSQLKLISRALQHLPSVEVNTVDSYQGRDKKCIVFSLVRSNTAGEIGRLLKDWRRINVAFTRAKMKLIIIGSGNTLRNAGRKKDSSKSSDTGSSTDQISGGASSHSSAASATLSSLGSEAGEATIRKFMQVVEENRWLYRLPRDADRFYPTLGRMSGLHSRQLSKTKQYMSSSSPKLVGKSSKEIIRVVANPNSASRIRGVPRKPGVPPLSVGGAVVANISSTAAVKESRTPA
eukprot:g3329.t1